MRLRELRENKGLLQRDVADYLHCSIPVYCRYEKEDRVPPYEVITALADYYDVSVDYILGRDNAQPASQPAPEETAEPEIRILARDMAQLSPERKKKAYDLLRLLMEEDDDDTIDQATRVIKALRRND